MNKRKVKRMTDDVIDGTGFDGVWHMDQGRSRVWDEETNQWRQEPIEAQTLDIRHEGDVMHYRIAVKHSPTLTIHMTYECRFSDEKWAPYSVVDIEGDAGHDDLKPGDLLKSGIRLGEPIAYIKQVYVDPRTQYRITRNLDGTAQYAMLRRLSDDGQTNTGTVLTPQGVATISKVFGREKPADGVDVLRR
jgi:hypothetical protein